MDMYIGRTTFREELAPAKLLINSSFGYTAGLFYPYGGSEYHITDNIEYYAKEPSCAYRWVNSSKGADVPNAVNFTSGFHTLYIGRVDFRGAKEVGKVALLYKKMYVAFEGKEYEQSEYEVLVCDEKVEDEKDASVMVEMNFLLLLSLATVFRFIR